MVAITPEKAHRLAVGLARWRRIPYAEAERILQTMTLRIVADAETCGRIAGQAALLSAVNSAHRAFLGGVDVQLPAGMPLLLPQVRTTTLNEALTLTGCRPRAIGEPTHTIFVGALDATAKPDDVLVHCDGWRGGSSEVGNPASFTVGDADDIALGGIFAGASAVHRCFARAAGLPARFLGQPLGVSLWGPRENWLTPVPHRRLVVLPKRLWLLGLGHLGQAFLWNLAFLPYENASEVEFWLNDFDSIDESNHGSGVLCDRVAVGRRKTRHCADWLDQLGFATVITERRFGANLQVGEEEPRAALCGFDRADARMSLDRVGFNFVVECGLGGSLADFDQAEIHVFPNRRQTAHDLWSQHAAAKSAVDPAIAALFGDHREVCGQLAIAVAGKSVSTSFVGLMAGALAVSELLRTFNRGSRFDSLSFNARCAEDWEFRDATRYFTASEIGAMGFVSVAAASTGGVRAA